MREGRAGERGQSPLLQAWEAICQRKSDDCAVMVPSEQLSLTFAQLDAQSKKLSAELFRFGLERRAVILHLPNGPDWLAAFLALRSLGAVVIALDESASPERVHEVAMHYRAAGIFGKEGLQRLAGRPRCWKYGCALLKLTSGTSGQPKGIVFSDVEMQADARNILSTMGIEESDRNLCLHPLGHSYALGNIVYPLLGFGVPMAFGSSALPGIIADELAASGATVLPTVPAVLEVLCKSTVESLAVLRLVVSAAAPLPAEWARTFLSKFGLRMHNFYGASETGGIAYDVTGDAGLTGEGVGVALHNVSLSLGRGGRLRVCSPAVSHYGRGTPVSEPASCLLADRASINNGLLHLQGRTDRTVKLAGKRVALDALEQSMLARHPGLRLAAFLCDGELCVAVENGAATAAALQSSLQRLAPARSRVLSIAKLPRTARGKIDYAALCRLLG